MSGSINSIKLVILLSLSNPVSFHSSRINQNVLSKAHKVPVFFSRNMRSMHVLCIFSLSKVTFASFLIYLFPKVLFKMYIFVYENIFLLMQLLLFENSSFLIEPILSKRLSCLLKKTPLALFNPSFFHMFLNVLFNRAVSSKSFSFTSNQSLKYRFSLQSNHSSFRKKLFSFKQYHYLFFNQTLPFQSSSSF